MRNGPRVSLYFLLLCAPLAACDDSSASLSSFDDREVVIDYADQVVVPTYQLLRTRAGALSTAVAALAAAPSASTLTAARDAWVATRVPWEQSEAHLFGPVSANGYDPAMDSWPVNRTDLDLVLASGNPLTRSYVAALPETQKGFHTLEYLLWGADGTKSAGSLTARELEYLLAVSAELEQVTVDLASSWTEGVAGAAPYRVVFTEAGTAQSAAYPSLTAAAQEILVGMSGIADEVANGKIADPYDAHDPTKVESPFSGNSLLDFADNVRGVLNAYTGAALAAQTSGRGLADYVAARDPALDQRVRAAVQTSLDALAAIPMQFHIAIVTPSAYPAIEAAQAAIRELQAIIDGPLSQLVLR